VGVQTSIYVVLPSTRAFLPCTEDERMQNSRAPGSYISKLYMSQIASHPSAAGAVQRMGRSFGRPTATSSPAPTPAASNQPSENADGWLPSIRSIRSPGNLCHSLALPPTGVNLTGRSDAPPCFPEFPLNCNARANTHTKSRKLTTFKL
jgi:hypothetical protein